MPAISVCFEGGEGVFKTTNVEAISSYLREKGFKVLVTKEPGTSHLPVTMELRRIMLDKAYDTSLTRQARELISQAIRSIHRDKLVIPSSNEYDFIIQDRGVISGFAYGLACGNSLEELINLSQYIIPEDIDHPAHLYDKVIFLTRPVGDGLKTAISAKNEFEAGDAIEAKGVSFMEEVSKNFNSILSTADNVHTVDVSDKTKDEVLQDIVRILGV
jgi:dTMP kinase